MKSQKLKVKEFGKGKDNAERLRTQRFAEKRDGNTEVRREKRKAEEGFLSTRPDAPQCGAKEKVGPLCSE